MDDFYHDGHFELQDLNDTRRIAEQLYTSRRHETFTELDRSIINGASSFFIATASADGFPDCSIKSGMPGFVKILNSNTLQFPDYDGNGMFRTLGNILLNPNIGMLFVQFDGNQYKLRLNGTASITRNPVVLAGHVGATAVVEVKARDIFPNCPRYTPKLQKMDDSEFSPRLDYYCPEPFWKSKPDLRPYLPKHKEVTNE